MKRLAIVLVALMVALVGCSGDDETATSEPTGGGATTEQRFPDVSSAVATRNADDSWTFTVTVSSPYDSAQRFADAWRVRLPGGRVLAVRRLSHHHADEQPFTRSLDGVMIPAEIARVVIEARDSINGYGGRTITVRLPGAP